MRETLKNEIGITLIALAITIVILLILAGIAISILGENNGLFNYAKKAKNNTLESQEIENAILGDYENQIEKHILSAREQININEVHKLSLTTNSTGTGCETIFASYTVPYDCLLYAECTIDFGGYLDNNVILLEGIKLNDKYCAYSNSYSRTRTFSRNAIIEAKEGEKINFFVGLYDGAVSKTMTIGGNGIFVRILRKL